MTVAMAPIVKSDPPETILHVSCVVRELAEKETDEETKGTSSAGTIRLPLLEALPLAFSWESIRAHGASAYVFASETAVKSVARTLARDPLFLAWWNNIRERAHFAAVGWATADAAASVLSLADVVFPPNAKGLAAALAHLAHLAHLASQADPSLVAPFNGRVAVFGAREGRASRPFAETEAPLVNILAVACYDLVPLKDSPARVAELIATQTHLVFECGAASVASALCDALPATLPAGVKFLPRHASAFAVLRARLEERAASSHLLPVQA